MFETIKTLIWLTLCIIIPNSNNAVNLNTLHSCSETIVLDHYLNAIDGSYDKVEGHWQPEESNCFFKLSSSVSPRNIQLTIKYEESSNCQRRFLTNWQCPGYFDSPCDSMYYSTYRSGNPILWEPDTPLNLFSDFVKLLHCGRSNYKIYFVVKAKAEVMSDDSYNSSFLIRVIIPALSVGIFIILVSFFILFAVRWKVFRCDSHGHGRRLRTRRNHNSERSGQRGSNDPPPPPPPPYEEINKYPLSVRFQEQLMSAFRHARDSLRNSFRSVDTPPPNYEVAVATIANNNLQTRGSEEHRASATNPAYQPDEIIETPTSQSHFANNSGSVSPQVNTLSKLSRQVITCPVLHPGGVSASPSVQGHAPSSPPTGIHIVASTDLPNRSSSSTMEKEAKSPVISGSVVVNLEMLNSQFTDI